MHIVPHPLPWEDFYLMWPSFPFPLEFMTGSIISSFRSALHFAFFVQQSLCDRFHTWHSVIRFQSGYQHIKRACKQIRTASSNTSVIDFMWAWTDSSSRSFSFLRSSSLFAHVFFWNCCIQTDQFQSNRAVMGAQTAQWSLTHARSLRSMNFFSLLPSFISAILTST